MPRIRLARPKRIEQWNAPCVVRVLAFGADYVSIIIVAIFRTMYAVFMCVCVFALFGWQPKIQTVSLSEDYLVVLVCVCMLCVYGSC